MVITEKQYQKAVEVILAYQEQLNEKSNRVSRQVNSLVGSGYTKETMIRDTSISLRAIGVVSSSLGVHATLGDVCELGIYRLLLIKGMGKSSLNEIKDACIRAGLKLKY